jgi:hypothetical protein
MGSRLARTVAVLAISFAAATATAGNDDAARSLADTAYDLAKAGKYDDAIDLYRKAHDLSGLPVMIFNIAKCQQKKGDVEAARESYRRYLEQGDDPGLKAAAEKALQEMPPPPAQPTSQPARPAPQPEQPGPATRTDGGWVAVVADVDGARVALDERLVGVTPLPPIEAAPGRHGVTVLREGYADFATTVVVSAGETVRVDATLVRLDGTPAPVAPAAPTVSPTAPASEPVPTATTTVEAPAPPPRAPALYGAGVLSAGSVGLTLETGFPTMSLSVLVPARQGVQVEPHLDFDYGRATDAPVLGLSVGARVKAVMASAGRFDLAFVFDPAFRYAFPGGNGAVALRLLAPWLWMSWAFDAGPTIYWGIKVPIEFEVWPDFHAIVPLLFGIGVEVPIADGGTRVAVGLDLGPHWTADTSGSVLRIAPGARACVAFVF